MLMIALAGGTWDQMPSPGELAWLASVNFTDASGW